MDAQILDRGAVINAAHNNGMTPLHKAACNRNANLCALLLDRGATIDAKDSYNRSSHFLVVNGSHDVRALVLDQERKKRYA